MRINTLDLSCDTRDCAVRNAGRLSLNHDLTRLRHLLISHVEAGLDVFANSAAMVFSVTGNTKYGYRLVEPVVIVDAELTADRTLSCEEVFGHRLVHDGHTGRTSRVLRLDAA